MLVLTIKDGECFYIGETKLKVFIEEVYIEGRLERVVEFEVEVDCAGNICEG